MNLCQASIAIAIVLVTGACSKNNTPAASEAPEAAASVAASASAPAAPSAAPSSEMAVDDTPPTEERADHKAAREITKANYKVELGKIEKEIGPP